jgi:predicted permease
MTDAAEQSSRRWESFAQDIRYAVRGLRARPGFTIAVVLTLALGIGANAAMFSVVDQLLFRAPPMLREPALTHRVYLTSTWRGKEFTGGGIQYARFVDITNLTKSFTRTAAFFNRNMAIGEGLDAREMQVAATSAAFFGFFDAPPAAGRYYTAAEDTPPTGTPVAVLSYGLWQTQFGGRADAIGQSIQISSTRYTIIGVAPQGFVGLWPDAPPAAFIPITAYGNELGEQLRLRGENWWSTYHWTWSQMIAERKPGVTVEGATADLTAAYLKSDAIEVAADHDRTPVELRKPHAIAASVLSERGPRQSSEAKVAAWVAGVAVVVWLIACANVANLLLARALRRRREIAVRLALGVSRARLAAQLLTESVILAALGGAAGVIIAQFGGALLRSQLLPKAEGASVIQDPRTLLFAGVAALTAGLLTGLAPVFQSRKADLTLDLKAGAREGTVHRSRTRVALLIFQGALSVVLLVGAGLFVRSLHNVSVMRLGYEPGKVDYVSLQMRGVKLDSAQRVALTQRLVEEARTIPGVEKVATTVTLPFWMTWNTDLHVAGIDTVDKLGEFDLNAVTPDFFTTMGTRIVRGRGISTSDVAGAPRSMVISEAMGKKIWPKTDPIGQCVKVDSDTMPCTFVVGIAENTKSRSLSDDPGLFYYLSSAQFNPDRAELLVRVSGERAGDRETIRKRLQALMPGSSYVNVTPLSEVVGHEMQSWKLGAAMFTVFGILALVLAAIGLYSVIAYNVAQRTHELGVRVALGAQMRDVVGLVLREGMGLAVVGVVIGSGIALLLGKWVRPLLFEVSPYDPVVMITVAGILLGVAAAASLVPARRAGRVDPMTALRSE